MGKHKVEKASLPLSGSMNEHEIVSDLKKRIKELEARLELKKDAGNDLKEKEENLRDIFETIPEGVIHTTLDGKVLSTNGNFERLLGLSSEEILGENIIEISSRLMNKQNLQKMFPLLKRVISGNEIKPFQIELKDKILEVSVKINLRTKRLTATFRDITETKKTENTLRVSEARLRRAELASKSGNWELHLDTGKIVSSDGAAKLYGFNSTSIDYNIIREVPLPEYREMMDKALNELIKENKPYNIEFQIKNKETGEIIDIHSISEYDSSSRTLFGSIQDITERKKAEEEIKRKNQNLAKLFSVTIDFLELVDQRKLLERIVEKGPAVIEMASGAIYLVRGEDLYLETTSPPLPEDFPDIFRHASMKNHPHIGRCVKTRSYLIVDDVDEEELTPEEREIVEKRGLKSMIYIPLIIEKEVKAVLIFGTIGMKHNLTDEERSMCLTLSNIASLALQNSILFNNLVAAKEKAEESDRLKTSFLHNISHEIRTPLNAIIGFSRFLNQEELSNEEKKTYFDIIDQSNNQLLSIINDILNISQIESGQVVLQELPFDLCLTMRNIHKQFQPEAERKGLSFILEMPEDEEGRLFRIDGNKIIQIITNLLSNAFKFTNQGIIRFGFRKENDRLSFFVEDTGIGIPQSEQERIFERFYQVDKSLTKAFSGTGLGLSISDAYVKIMGGKLTVCSEPDKGSSFNFSIPYKRESTIREAKKSVVQTDQPNKPVKSRRILIAEDEHSNSSLIEVMLRSVGYDLLHASNGQEAVDICNSETQIDLVLMDIKMPVKDGFIAASEIAAKKPGIPIIAQSAYTQPDDLAKAAERGCVDCISKPYSKEQLLSVIRKYIPRV